MRERKYVKLRVDMYSDTKFKIIDTMEERDVIHYIWTRLLTLAGKVNLEGNLYMSKNIPYTVETLSIEFNRSGEKVRLALKVLKDLEMIECNEDGVYRVRNFAKHQSIKVKEQKKNLTVNEDMKGQGDIIKHTDNRGEIEHTKNKSNKSSKIIDIKNNKDSSVDDENINLDAQNMNVDNKNIATNECNTKQKLDSDLNSNMSILLEKKKTQKGKPSSNKRKGKDDIVEIDEEDNEEDDEIMGFFNEEEIPKCSGDKLIRSFKW